MTDPHTLTIPIAAAILKSLRQKPKEQLSFTPEAVSILHSLESRGLATKAIMSNLPEQNVWTITPQGLTWLERHNL